MDRIPLYARARRGDPDVAVRAGLDRRATTRDAIELHVFVPGRGQSTSFLQEDDGLTLDGAVRRTRFEVTGSIVRAGSDGDYAGARLEVVAHGGAVQLEEA